MVTSYYATRQRFPVKLAKRMFHPQNLSNRIELAPGPDGSDVVCSGLSRAQTRCCVSSVPFLQIEHSFCTFFVTVVRILFQVRNDESNRMQPRPGAESAWFKSYLQKTCFSAKTAVFSAQKRTFSRRLRHLAESGSGTTCVLLSYKC